MPPTPTAFRDLLLALDAEGLTAFVAAVYDARGWTVDRDGNVLRVRPGEERDWCRLVVDPADPGSTDADRVVVPTLAPDGDADRFLDAAALLELTWYAVDDTDRTRLCRAFFDRDPTEFEAASGADEQSAGSATATLTDAGRADVAPDAHEAAPTVTPAEHSPTDRDSSPPFGRRLTIVVVILLVVGGVAVVVGPTLLSSGNGGAASDDAGGSDTATATPVDAAPLDSVARERAGTTDADADADADVTAVDGPLPPGVGPGGIENASALIDAHEAALDGRSYRLSVVAREFVGGSPTAVARERTVVEGPTRYRSDVSVIGTFRQEPRAIGTVSTYANGTTRFVRLTTDTDADGTIRFTERGGESGTAGGPGWRSVTITRPADPFANRTAMHLRGVLDVDDATIVGSFERDGTTYVWIDLRRRPPGGTDAIDSILVDEDGLVHEMRHEYAYLPPEASTVRTVVTVRVVPANVTASPPSWR